MKTTRTIEINGAVETALALDTWLDEFVEWLESRGEVFGGGTHTSSDDPNSASVQVTPQVSHKRRKTR